VSQTGTMSWVVSGERFLAVYAIAVCVALLVALLARWMTGAGAGATSSGDVVELAYLAGGTTLACYTCGAGLRRAGAVAPGPLSTVVASGRLPRRAPSLMVALHQALQAPQTWSQVQSDPVVSAALRRVHGRVRRRGWLLSPAEQRRYRRTVMGLFVVAGVGLIRLLACIPGWVDAGRPGANVGLVMAVTATMLIGWLLREPPSASPAGRLALSRARHRFADLAPGKNRTGGVRSVSELMTAVALFGPQVLLAVDPVFGEVLGIAWKHKQFFPSGTTRPHESLSGHYLDGTP
jgi:uncharacterized protein (TIGR04222 family)